MNTGSLEDILSNDLNLALSTGPSRDNEYSPAEFDDDSDNDCVMIGQIVPVPLNSTTEGLIKKDEDPISDDKPYITTVSCILF